MTQNPSPDVAVPEPRFLTANEVGDSFYGAFVICRGCGCPIPYLHQPAMRAHTDTCEPLRRTR